MKKHYGGFFLFSLALFAALTLTAFADSSWRWISDTRPYDVLPYVAVATLLIETVAICYIPKINRPLKTFFVVLMGNLLSFAAPYLLEMYASLSMGYDNKMYGFIDSMESWPFYTIGFWYLFVTILVELPIEYVSLKKDTINKKVLLFAIVGSNALTTAMTAIVERVICKGHW